ncbi:terminase DNA packaging enzyme, partial [Vibrio phage 1.244.A._10N.261.54.C3]
NGSLSKNLLATLDQVEAEDIAHNQLELERAGLDDRAFGGVDPEGDLNYDMIVPNLKESKVQRESKVLETVESDISEDYKHVRDTTYALQSVTTELLQNALTMAVRTENPRAYSTVNDLVETVRNLNKDLLNNAKALHDIQGKKQPLNPGGKETEVEVTGDGVKVTQREGGKTTANLMAMVEEMRKSGGKASNIKNDDFINGDIEEAQTDED